jgi:O-antigen ligase
MRINRLFRLLLSFALASGTTLAIVVNAYGDASHPTRITQVLLGVLVVHAFTSNRFWFSREVLLGIAFLGYSLLSLAWTDYLRIAFVTLPAMLNSLLVLIIFAALAAYHDIRALLAGMFVGFMAGACLYTLTSGFPFTYPEDFSYNTIASMYLFGLFITLVFGAFIRSTVLPVAVGVVLLALIAATTSIKSNLGIALGMIGAGILYFRLSMRGLVKGAIVVAIFGAAIAYGIYRNPALTERVQSGFSRVSTGLAVLTNRESDTGGIGLQTRQGWQREGVRGWLATPVFGHGVEGFRADFGITSHSTPIDLLYNAGLIGFGLFYAMLGSIAWRLLQARDRRRRSLRARIAVFLITYSFISLSGIIYYDQFLPIYLAVSAGLLVRLEEYDEVSANRRVRAAGKDLELAARA